MDERADDGDPLIRAEHLSKTFHGHRAVVDVSLTLRRGNVIGFVGPNGAGKTTTLRMLAGLLSPDGGVCDVFGQNLYKQVRGNSQVGYMPQKLALYGDLSIRDNLRFRADIYQLTNPEIHVSTALKDFGLEDRQHLPANQLSGGWARRLQLAAVLIHRPAIVLLDEPTAGLDSQSKQEVWRRIQLMAEGGAGVIVNTHDDVEAEQCSWVALFRFGRVVLQGSPSEIEASAGVRAALVQTASSSANFEVDVLRNDLLAVEPHGRRWRIVVRAERFYAVCKLIEDRGGTVFPDETRLSDVVLLYEREIAVVEGE